MSSQSDYDAIVIGSGMGGLVFASTTRGIIKMIADDRTEEVLGVSMVGTNAGEVIHEAAMGLRFRAKISDFIDLLHVYPTMAQALKIVAISRFKDPAKLSCCAE